MANIDGMQVDIAASIEACKVKSKSGQASGAVPVCHLHRAMSIGRNFLASNQNSQRLLNPKFAKAIIQAFSKKA